MDLKTVSIAPPRGLAVKIERLEKNFGGRHVLRGVSLNVRPGEFLTIVGRSGCGKSTLLRLLAGLDQASAGTIRVDGQVQTGRHEDCRIMYQEARLLPWKSVIDNVAIGLPGSRRAVREAAREVLAQVGLADRGEEWPGRLSGGQRQRVALARALIHQPGLLLLDEPLGALDALTRIEMQQLIESLWQQRGFTALLVTHDVSEAVVMGDRVVLIEDGEVALDHPVHLLRPRQRGNAAVAALEECILDRVMRRGSAANPEERAALEKVS